MQNAKAKLWGDVEVMPVLCLWGRVVIAAPSFPARLFPCRPNVAIERHRHKPDLSVLQDVGRRG